MTDQDQRSIFISYSHADSQFVNSFASMLLKYDLNIWKDSKDILIGGNILKSVYDGIKGVSHFCCIISSSSIKSAWVEEELSYAKVRQLNDRSLCIVPVLIDEVEIPDYLKAYLNAHLENRDLSIKNPELLKILKAFGIDLEEFARDIITGPDRKLLLECCEKLRQDLSLFREILLNFQDAYLEYESAISNKGYDRPDAEMPYRVGLPSRYSPPTTHGSDYRIKRALEGATGILKTLKVYASNLRASVEHLRQAWEKVNPASGISHLHPDLSFTLDLTSYMSKTIAEASDASANDNWWVREKLSRWVKELPRAEASIEGASALLKSWANFDPKE